MSNELTQEGLGKLKAAQLVELADRRFNAEFEKNTTKADMVGLMLEMQGDPDTYPVGEDVSAEDILAGKSQETVKDAADGAPVGDGIENTDEKAAYKDSLKRGADLAGRKDKQYRVRIFKSDAPDGKQPVKVSVNGYAYAIQRDKEVTVPERVVNALRNAVELRFTPDDEKLGSFREDSVPRYNMEVTPV